MINDNSKVDPRKEKGIRERKTLPPWCYDEFKQVGKDYSDVAEVVKYDATHADFRNLEWENNYILNTLGVKQDDLLIDIGSETGTLANSSCHARGKSLCRVMCQKP